MCFRSISEREKLFPHVEQSWQEGVGDDFDGAEVVVAGEWDTDGGGKGWSGRRSGTENAETGKKLFSIRELSFNNIELLKSSNDIVFFASLMQVKASRLRRYVRTNDL